MVHVKMSNSDLKIRNCDAGGSHSELEAVAPQLAGSAKLLLYFGTEHSGEAISLCKDGK